MRVLQVGERPFRRSTDHDDLLRRGVRRDIVHFPFEAFPRLQGYFYDVLAVEITNLQPAQEQLIVAVRASAIGIGILAVVPTECSETSVRILDLGADDVLLEVCPIDEVLARMRAVHRRAESKTSRVPRFGPLELCLATRKVHLLGRSVQVTQREFTILDLLISKRGGCVTKEAFASVLYQGLMPSEFKTLATHIGNLRRKLDKAGGGELIESVRKQGYRLTDAVMTNEFVS